MNVFSPETRSLCADAGIDIERSYARMQADLRAGRGLLIEMLTDSISTLEVEPLTGAEHRALTAIARLGRRERVAAELGVGLQTVMTHLASVRRKLKALNTTNAVAIGIRQGIIKPPIRPRPGTRVSPPSMGTGQP